MTRGPTSWLVSVDDADLIADLRDVTERDADDPAVRRIKVEAAPA
jgi:hypothetical protein